MYTMWCLLLVYKQGPLVALFTDNVHTSTAKSTDVQLVKGPLVVSNGVHTSARHTLVYTLVKQAHFGVPTLVYLLWCARPSLSHKCTNNWLRHGLSSPPPLFPNCVTEEGPGGHLSY